MKKRKTLIRANHDECPPTKLAPENITVSLIPNQLYGTYTFLCTHCKYLITKTASTHIIDRLIDDAQVQYTVEPAHPSHLTIKDLYEFNLELYSTD